MLATFALRLFFDLALVSSAFQNGGALPRDYTCDGADRSPPLEIVDQPIDATTWVLVADEPETGKILWAAWNLGINERFLKEGVPKDVTTLRIRQGRNYKKHLGWNGPCPTATETHHVRFRAFALRRPIAIGPTGSGSDILEAVRGLNTIEEAELTATYSR